MNLLLTIAVAAGTMSATVDDDGWVTQTATVQGGACVLIICDCEGASMRTGGEPGTIELKYRALNHLDAPLPFVYEHDDSLVIVRQEFADLTDDRVSIDELQVRLGMGYGMMYASGRENDTIDRDLYRERCRLSHEAASEAAARAKAEAETPDTP